MTPEENARQEIDRQLIDAGWAVQDYKAINLSAGRGIALREVPLKTGPCDYLLLVDRRPVGPTATCHLIGDILRPPSPKPHVTY